jgi:lipopolysaccharide export system permease protein
VTLHFYIARRFTLIFLGVFGSFFALTMLIEATALFGQFDQADIGVMDTLRLALLKAPASVYQLLPMIVVLGSLTLFLSFSRHGELVATRSAGLSSIRALLGPTIVALTIGVISVAAFNPMAATALRQFESETGRYASGTTSSFSLSRKGLWLRQGSDQGQTVIFAQKANFDATRLSGVTFFEFDPAGIAQRRIETGSAVLATGSWRLGPGKFWQINQPGVVPDRTAQEFATLTLASELTSEQILDSFGDPRTISIWNMPTFIDRLERSGFSTGRHRAYFQIELASPILLAAMVMIGAALTMRPARSGSVGIMILFTVVAGLAVFIFQDFAQILGSNGAIPVLAAAWGPPISAILFALGLLLHMEDG